MNHSATYSLHLFSFRNSSSREHISQPTAMGNSLFPVSMSGLYHCPQLDFVPGDTESVTS